MLQEHQKKRVLQIVFFTVLLDLVGFGIIIPVQPFYAESLGASPSVVTLLGAVYSIMQFLFAPFWGRLSDRIGRRPVMLTSIALGSVGYFLFGWATTLQGLFLARMLSGFGNANIGAAQAVIADSTSESERAKGMGLIGAAFGLGFIFGPALGGFLGQISLSLPGYVGGALGLLNGIVALFYLPETRPPRAGGAETSASRKIVLGFSPTELKRAFEFPHVQKMLILFLSITMGFSLMEQVLGLFVESTWMLPEVSALENARSAARLTTYVLVTVGLTSTIVQGGLIGRLAHRFGERHLLSAGPLITGLSFVGIVLAGRSGVYAFLLLVAVFMALGTGLTNPSLTSILSQLVDREERGTVMGLGQSFSALGRAVGPIFSGILFERNHSSPFLIGAFLMIACSYLGTRLPRSIGLPTRVAETAGD